ncbi:WD domain, G-beta repeat protein [Oesophagostomum dentatum]|uniref:WD domain, G-beta repeat protein n=1 Tax=Oesophagostomum dentatum TaxID=61180 RepID=A0A0B1T5J1_OESDE|nr:WD domain, G-beta repeat protein [Oesophagostomum dentatum]
MEVDEEPSTGLSCKEDAALVQPDWDQALKEMTQPQFFVGLRKHEGKSVFANVEKQGDSYICTDPLHPCNALHFESPAISTTFLSPVSEIRGIHDSSIHSMDISCTGNLIVSSDASGSLVVSNVMNGSLLRDLKGHVMDVYKCRFFPSGLVVLSGGMDMSVKKATIVTDNTPTAVCIDHETDSVIYIGDEEGVISVYDLKFNFYCFRSYIYRLQTNRGCVMKMMTRDEGLFVAFKDGSMCCYPRQRSLESKVTSPLYEFTGSDCDPIYDFCFNAKHLFTASRDRVVRKYRIP